MIRNSILFASSEVYPFAKSGGLADVAHSLPRALNEKCHITVIMPLYRFIERQKFMIEPLGESFIVKMGGVDYPVELYGCRFEGITYRFVYSPVLSDKEFLYGPPESGYEDNAIRFGVFNQAIIRELKKESYDLVHLNDWQTALVPLLIKEEKTITTKTLFTIHNLAYQGTFPGATIKKLGIDEKYFSMDGIEFYTQINFMKAGIAFADMITTVSPTYAKEILTSDFGCGLEGFLELHRNKLVGIVNGIDSEHFTPSKDKALVMPFTDMKGKTVNKNAYLKEKGLKGSQKPLFVFIGRFTWQKGMDIFIEALPKIAALECNIAILGDGEKKYYDALKTVADSRSNVHLEFGYNEDLSHRMYAAADFLLMPSLFEPCGLNQMIAMHYGQVPVVNKVGGLADTVYDYQDFDPKSSQGFGIVFDSPDPKSFSEAVTKAVSLYSNESEYNKIIKHNMQCDFSWQESAKAYLDIYNQTLRKRKNG